MEKISIYDNDLGQLLVDNRPVKTAYQDFLHYVGDESLGQWWSGNEDIAPIFNKIVSSISDNDFNKIYDSLFSLWVDEVVTTKEGKKYIQQEIHAYNFEIIK